MIIVEVIVGCALLWATLFFVVVPVVLARVGGWARLAAEYRFRGRFDGRRWWMQNLTLRGWCGYNGCVSVGANADGLFLNTIFWVRHPPLFIPWHELSISRRNVRFFGFRTGQVEFQVARVPGVTIAIHEAILKKMAAEVQTHTHDPHSPATLSFAGNLEHDPSGR